MLKRYLPPLVVLLVLVLAFAAHQQFVAFRSDDRSADSEPDRGLVLNENLFYYERYGEEGLPRVEVELDGEREVLSEDFPSRPEIGPDRRQMVFIAPAEWEQIGTIYLYDVRVREKEALVTPDMIPEHFTPKRVLWVDSAHLLAIIGYGYGTVSVGGDLYLVGIEDETLTEVYSPGEHREVKDMELEEEGPLVLQVAEFDAEFMDYDLERVEFDLEGIMR